MILSKKTVKYITIVILAVFCLSPIIANKIYHRPRTIETISTNIYDANFRKQWSAIIETIENKENLQSSRVNTLQVEYDTNGNIENFRLDIIAKDNDKYRLNRVILEEWDRYIYTQSKFDYNEGYEDYSLSWWHVN